MTLLLLLLFDDDEDDDDDEDEDRHDSIWPPDGRKSEQLLHVPPSSTVQSFLKSSTNMKERAGVPSPCSQKFASRPRTDP